MFNRRSKERGQALAEFVMLLPIMTMLFAGVIEVSNAINAHITIVEASRGACRLIVYQGNTNGVDTQVQTLTARLPSSRLVTTATQGTDKAGSRKYTVQVQYDYRTVFNNAPILSHFMPSTLTLRASTTMPVPY